MPGHRLFQLQIVGRRPESRGSNASDASRLHLVVIDIAKPRRAIDRGAEVGPVETSAGVFYAQPPGVLTTPVMVQLLATAARSHLI